MKSRNTVLMPEYSIKGTTYEGKSKSKGIFQKKKKQSTFLVNIQKQD